MAFAEILSRVPTAPTSKPSAKQRFALNVRMLRHRQQITQERLAELAGLHVNYVGSVERGERNISIQNIEKIAHALGVDIRVLFDESKPSTGRVGPTRVRG